MSYEHHREAARLGYVLSQYPAVNHTFILREVQALRRLGMDIVTVSIREPDRAVDRLSPEEAEEHRLTWSVMGAGLSKLLGAHLRTALRRPAAYYGGVLYALRLAGCNLRPALRHLAWFAEAVAIGDHLSRRGVGRLHSHFTSTVTLLTARVFKMDFSVTIHGPDEFNDVTSFHMAEKVARASFIATISQYAASQVMRASQPQHWRKIHPLPLGVDVTAFAPRPRRESPDAFHLLCVGRLTPAKAHHILLKAMARLVSEGMTNVRLTLVGDGPSRPSLERAIAELKLDGRVRLAGACNPDRVSEFLAESDAFALASFAEGVPVVLMEAMAMQVPCIATWVAGVPELIRSEIDGLLIPPADPDALAGAIARMIRDPELRVRLATSARRRVAELYDLHINTARLADAFWRIAAGGQAAFTARQP